VLSAYRELLPAAPEDLFGFFAFLVVPPGPPFPVELHGKPMCGIVWCWTGRPRGAADAMAPMLRVAEPALHGVQELPYPALQSAFDALYPPGQYWYWRGDFVDEIPDEAVARHLAFGSRLPSPGSSMHLYPIDGAVHRIAPDATAFAYRDATFSQVIVGVDPDLSMAPVLRSWVVDYWEALHPFSAGGAYVNFLMDEGQERVHAAYRGNLDRLARVKARYDPENLFHVNQNVRPAVTRP